MKKNILILLLLFPFFLKAQLFEGGIDFGLTASQIDGDTHGGFHKLGVSALFYSQLNIRKNFFLTSGVAYVQKGAHSKVKTTFFSTNLHYAELPLIFTYKPFNRLSFSAGPTFGYLIKGVQKTDFGIFDEQYLGLKKFDLSYYFSVNYDLADRWTVRFVNNYNLLPITKPTTGSCLSTNIFFFFMKNPSAGTCWWSNVIRLTLQYKIFWNKKEN